MYPSDAQDFVHKIFCAICREILPVQFQVHQSCFPITNSASFSGAVFAKITCWCQSPGLRDFHNLTAATGAGRNDSTVPAAAAMPGAMPQLNVMATGQCMEVNAASGSIIIKDHSKYIIW